MLLLVAVFKYKCFFLLPLLSSEGGLNIPTSSCTTFYWWFILGRWLHAFCLPALPFIGLPLIWWYIGRNGHIWFGHTLQPTSFLVVYYFQTSILSHDKLHCVPLITGAKSFSKCTIAHGFVPFSSVWIVFVHWMNARVKIKFYSLIIIKRGCFVFVYDFFASKLVLDTATFVTRFV